MSLPSARTPAPPISLGELSFALGAPEIRRRADRILRAAEERLEALVTSNAPPTISEFLEPLDRILASVRDVGDHGGFLFAVHPLEENRTAAREISEAADRFFNALRVNERVYLALGALPVPADDPATRFAVDKMRREMRRSGVELDPAARARLLALNNAIDQSCNEFQENIARSSGAIEVSGASELEGMPPDFLAAHPPGPDGKVRITTKSPDLTPVMAHCDRAHVRRQLLAVFMNTAHPENVPVLERIRAQRHTLARSLGYASYAQYAIENKMLETPDAARRFLEQVATLLRTPSQHELARYLARKQRDDPAARTLHSWDSGFLAEGYYDGKLRAEEFGVDSSALRKYLPYVGVRDGLFRLCEELFGLTFHRTEGVELWDPSVEAYDVRRSGELLGRCYLDLVPRDGKYNHAACFPVRGGLAGIALPQSALVCNFLDPHTPRERVRMEYAQVVTFFHEFGHLLHALLSGHGRWLYNSMGLIEWDFVEAPSQLFEEWARDPATLSRFARDPDTGEPIPAALLERLRAADGLGRPTRWLRQVALASVSLGLYDHDPSGADASELMRETYDRYAPVPLEDGYHPVSGFGHLTGYSAFYYTYVWSLVIARDLLRPFLEKGTLTDPGVAARYAREILAPGSSRPAAELVRRYLGREFGFRSFEEWIAEGIAASGTPGAGAPSPTARS
jgi:thimet oligopeptidase